MLSPVVAFNSAYRLTALIRGQGSAIDGMYVSGGFFGALGMPPAAGRLIGVEDDREDAPPVAVVSYGFAQRQVRERRAGGRRDCDHQRRSVRRSWAWRRPGFYGISPGQAHDIYLPQHASILVDRIYAGDPRAKYADPKFYWCEILGRLRPGVTIAQAQAAPRAGVPSVRRRARRPTTASAPIFRS